MITSRQSTHLTVHLLITRSSRYVDYQSFEKMTTCPPRPWIMIAFIYLITIHKKILCHHENYKYLLLYLGPTDRKNPKIAPFFYHQL